MNDNFYINEVLVSKKNKVIVTPNNKKQDYSKVMTACANFTMYNYVFSQKLIDVLQTISDHEFEAFIDNTSKIIKKNLGAHKKYNPMYPNFPKQVMNADYAELFWNAVLHYMFGIIPEYDELSRPELKEAIQNCKVLDIGTIDDYNEIIKNIISSNTSISPDDKRIINIAINNCENFLDILPDEIPFKENLCYVSGQFINNDFPVKYLFDKFNCVTDVLRLAVHLSNGDISLATQCKFSNFSRKYRRMFMEILNRFPNKEDEMLKYEGMWIRLGEKIHSGEYENRYPNSFNIFNNIRNHRNGKCDRIRSFDSKVEKYIIDKNISDVICILKTRPGVFARRLDQLLRNSDDKNVDTILNVFENISNSISTPVLMQIHSHFENRNYERLAFPKGMTNKMINIPGHINEFSVDVTSKVKKICYDTMLNRFEKLSPLGKVYIDPKLENIFVPYAQRTANRALKSLPRGSKIPFGDYKFVRFFMWWKDGIRRTDLDLSTVCYDSNWIPKESIWYGNLKDSYGCHSGDITSAPNGACEFIDINIEKALNSGIRYVQMSVNCFTGQKLIDLPESFSGFMGRNDAESGEIFDARTVLNKIDLTTNSVSSIPMIVDLLKREIIWCDFGFQKGGSHRNICTDMKNNINLGYSISNMKKFSLYELFLLHALSRGEIVDDINIADTIFSLDSGITPYDTDVICSEYIV